MRCAAHPQVAAGACPAVFSVRVPQQDNLRVFCCQFLAHCQRVIGRTIFHQQHFMHFGLGKRGFDRLPYERRGIIDWDDDRNPKNCYFNLNKSLRIIAQSARASSPQYSHSTRAKGSRKGNRSRAKNKAPLVGLESD